MDVNAVLYAGCMAAAQQLFDTMVRQQEADDDDVHNDDDNEVGDWDPDDDLVVGVYVAGNNNQEITTNIRKEKYILDFNYEGEKGVDKEFNNLCNQDDAYDDVNLAVGEGVDGNNNQK